MQEHGRSTQTHTHTHTHTHSLTHAHTHSHTHTYTHTHTTMLRPSHVMTLMIWSCGGEQRADESRSERRQKSRGTRKKATGDCARRQKYSTRASSLGKHSRNAEVTAEIRDQRAERREQRAESREQRAESREQRAQSSEQRAESRGQRVRFIVCAPRRGLRIVQN
jgi:hypothetical protein